MFTIKKFQFMKNTFSSLQLLAFGSFLLLLPSFLILKKAPTTLPKPRFREQLVNKWDIQSFTMDGVEIKGSVITSSTLKFGAQSNFQWTLHYKDDTIEHQSGHYTLDETTRKIEVENQRHEHFLLDVQVENNEIQLSGMLDGEMYVLKGKRDWK